MACCKRADLVIHLIGKGCQGIRHFNAGGHRSHCGQADIDNGHESFRKERDILHTTGRHIEDGIHPNTRFRAVRQCKDGAFHIFGRLGIHEFGIPMRACPATFALRSKQLSRASERGRDSKLKNAAKMQR